MTKRGMILRCGDTTAVLSLYGQGVHEFPLNIWQGLEDKPPKAGDVVEADFSESEDQILKVRQVSKNMEDLLRSLTPEEFAAVPRLDPEKIRESFRKGAEERHRYRSMTGAPRPTDELWRYVRALEKRVAELEARLKAENS